jgi:hypothetical protein
MFDCVCLYFDNSWALNGIMGAFVVQRLQCLEVCVVILCTILLWLLFCGLT